MPLLFSRLLTNHEALGHVLFLIFQHKEPKIFVLFDLNINHNPDMFLRGSVSFTHNYTFRLKA